jgi:hypothetical protein
MSMSRMAGIKDGVRRRGGLRAMGLKAQHLLVLIALADYEDDATGQCNPCSKTIGIENDQHHQRVRVLWGQLRRWGFIRELKRVQVATVGDSIYWAFNEEVFPKTIAHGYTLNQEPPTTITQGYTLKSPNHPPLQEPLKQSEMNQSLSLPSLPVQDDLVGGEDGIRAEKGKVALDVNGSQIPEGEGPKLPVILCLRQHLNGLKVTRPRRTESWSTLESRLQRKLNPAELLELEDALSWIFDPASSGYWSRSAKHWREALTDPNKADQLGFFVEWAWKILEDFQANRAHDQVNQQPDRSQQPAPKGKVRPKATRQHDDDEEETDLWTG